MSAPYIDVRGALDSTGIRYKRSGAWLRCRAVWRDSKADDLAIHSETGAWKDHGGAGEHGGWRQLCELLGIYNPNTTSTWTEADRAAWRARKEARKATDAADESRRMRGAMALWSRAVPLDHPTDPNAAVMRDYIRRRGLWMETIMQVARAGRSCGMPCLVYGRRDPRSGEITTIHREWDKRTWPADAGANKRGLGPQFFSGQTAYIEYNRWTGAGVAPGAMAAIAEGQLSGACAAELYPHSPVLSTFTMGGMERPPVARIKEVVEAGFIIMILGDLGGMKSAQSCARQILLACPNARIRVAIPPDGRVDGQKKGEDWLDVRVGYNGIAGIGDDATRDLIERCAVAPELGGHNGDDDAPQKNVTPMIPWRVRDDGGKKSDEMELPINEAQEKVFEILKAITPLAREPEYQGPAIVVGTVGVSKSTSAAKVIARDHDAHRIGCASNDAADAMCAAIPGAYRLKGRGQDTCFKWDLVKALQDQARGPAPWVCKANGGCPHWGSEAEKPCPYSLMVETARYKRVCVGVHSQFEEDSSFFEFWRNPGDRNKDNAEPVRLWADESPALTAKTKIDADAIRVWREGVTRARAALPKMRAEAAYDKDHHPVDEDTHEKNLKQVAKTEKWIDEMERALDGLALALAGAKTGAGIELLDTERFEDLVRLGTHVPAKARQKDATLIEGCVLSHATDPIIPLRGIEALATAIKNKTAWFQNGKIVAANPAKFWQRIVGGGILLDATPSTSQIEEVEARCGHVFTVRVQQPFLKRIKYGLKLHGKGGLRRADGVKLKAERAELLTAMASGPDPVVGTHKALAETFYAVGEGANISRYEPADRVRHYGLHKGHNDWAGEKRLISWGPHLSDQDDDLIEYHCARRAVIEAGGRAWDDWQGETARNMEVLTDTHVERHSVPLPTSPDALKWLQNKVTADLVQQEGRLRAVWATEPVVHEAYGFFPYKRHGYKVDEIRMEPTGRAAKKIVIGAAVAAGIVELGPNRARKQLSDFVYTLTKTRCSNATLDNWVRTIEAQALIEGKTLDEAASDTCLQAHTLLRAHQDDAAAAMVAADTGAYSEAVTLTLLIIHQRRARATGTLRAGP